MKIKTIVAIILFSVLGYMLLGYGETKPKYEVPTKEAMQEQYNLKASKLIMTAFQHAAFATELNCPCYDVVISTVPEGMKVDIDPTRCEGIK